MKNLIYILLISLTLQSCNSDYYSKSDLLGKWSDDKISVTFNRVNVYFNDNETVKFKYEFDDGVGQIEFETRNQEFELLSSDVMKYGDYYLNKE